jgi:hypothetical protein
MALVLNTHAAARAAVRVNTFRDRKTVNMFRDREAVNIFRDREAVNNLEFTFFSLLWSATERPGRTRAKWAWLKSDSAPSGFYECIANFKV